MSQTQLHYEVQASIGIVETRDVNFCAFVRAPITKQAGFCVIKLFLSQIMARQMESDIGRNEFPQVNLSIYVQDEAQQSKLQDIYDQTLICLKITPDTTIRFEEDRLHVTLLLVHPTLYYLSNHNTFNKIFLDQTAYDILGAYEGFLRTTFGEIFEPNHIGADVNQNSYVYEQILTRATNDLSIPDYLINTYKVNNSFCFYFFDPFYLADNGIVNEIVCQYINLQAKNEMTQIDINEFFDMQLQTNHLKSKSIIDLNQKFIDKRGNRIIHNERDIKSFYEKEPEETTLDHKLEPMIHAFPLVEDRGIWVSFEKGYTSYDHPSGSATSTIYSPDTIDNGQSRFDNAMKLLEDEILSLHYYEMSNCLPEFPQFGCLYNLEESNESNFIYTPLNIVNVFFRKNFREQYLYHMSKTVMLRYKGEG